MTDIATITESSPADESVTGGASGPLSSDVADLGEEVLVEEVSIDGMCGVY